MRYNDKTNFLIYSGSTFPAFCHPGEIQPVQYKNTVLDIQV